jgi:hypothetical protein
VAALGSRLSCNMDACPQKIYDAPVVAWAVLGPGIRPTGNTVHRVSGRVIGSAAGLAICQSTDGRGFYLFYCDSAWEEITDTWHQSIDDARAQAEFEYEGISSHWQYPAEPSVAPDCGGI